MEEDVKGLGDYLEILDRRKKQFIVPALLILLASVGLAFGLPSIYRSEATILIEQQEIPDDLVRSTVTSFAGERIQIISQRVMTTKNLSRIIEEYGLYEDERKSKSMSVLVEEMREEIDLEMISADVVDPRSGRPTTATIAFKVAFSGEGPRLAQRVTNDLVSLYLDENMKQRTAHAVETSSFLTEEASKLQEKINGLESKLAEFKQNNINTLPNLQQLNIQLMERAERDLKDKQQQIRTLEERRIYLQSELAQMNPTSKLYDSDGSRVLSSEDRLQALESEYVSLSARYSSSHPDLIKMEREIAALKKETGGAVGNANEIRRKLTDLKSEMAVLRDKYSPEHPDVKKLQRNIDNYEALLQASKGGGRTKRQVRSGEADNPAYIQLQTQLKAANSELRSLRESTLEIEAKLSDYEERLLKSPQVEREYLDLTREYENTLAKFQEVKAKQFQAELAESLERESKGERFSLIEPPQLPEEPDKPNRIAIFFLGFVFSLAGGFGTVAVAESMSEAIRSPKALMAITNTPPMIVIPYITIAADITRRRFQLAGFTLFSLIVAAGIVVLFHNFFMPLDVAWYVIQRRLGFDV
ncbi:MAG: lipopolysaccharide biosynthesis protein [Chromatiaceae bacterium]|nr:lipopolysaccharide biosynthesis protein [Gammaproteobacteria bacterium]MCB1860477.1 lipopolysaccharide biosynthesis protein [Gammaproteobacteria bacterium]MCB1879552.1 lipopolysaccharide biosynthesis protein [Gammaproteobacteria bacterium]MCB1902925.1 lipopolysaccharide biosynthesis protein [Gammaproteobacteria bacterium]MCP5445730.1 lipopolysaccharide biosynthesis protein [Chromatiaceae bacterium]